MYWVPIRETRIGINDPDVLSTGSATVNADVVQVLHIIRNGRRHLDGVHDWRYPSEKEIANVEYRSVESLHRIHM